MEKPRHHYPHVSRLVAPEHASFHPELLPFCRSNSKYDLKLPNGIQLNFGQIVALAGDLFGVPDEPIIDHNKQNLDTMTWRKQRFLSSHATLAHADYSIVKRELDQLISVMEDEEREMKDAIDAGESINEKKSNHFHERYDTALGGYWLFGIPVRFGRMMSLASSNFDHFTPFAREAYEVGHDLALEKAREASHAASESQELILQEAYSIDAFACHFLTDSFASGHIRTPRRELKEQIKPNAIGDLLSNYMHDEDGLFGLNVRNLHGDQWIAYGDGSLFHSKSDENRRIAKEAVEISASQVFEAFSHPDQKIFTTRVTDLIPFIDESKKNNYPLFQVRDGSLVRRNNLDNLADPNVTNFIGVTTLAKLKFYKPSGSCIEK